MPLATPNVDSQAVLHTLVVVFFFFFFFFCRSCAPADGVDPPSLAPELLGFSVTAEPQQQEADTGGLFLGLGRGRLSNLGGKGVANVVPVGIYNVSGFRDVDNVECLTRWSHVGVCNYTFQCFFVMRAKAQRLYE